MAQDGSILLVDEDVEDQEVMLEALQNLKLPNRMLSFADGPALINYLSGTDDRPFMILCNVHISGMDGLAIRRKIEETPELKHKSIPFIFYTSDDRKSVVEEAFEIPIQGYFCKEDTVGKMQKLLALLHEYWTLCKHPNAD